MGFKNILKVIFLAAMCLGFKVYPGVRGWKLDKSTTAGRKLFITQAATGETLKNNLPSSDPLGSAGANLTEAQILNSIINDFNNIQSSYLVLALDTDTDFAANSQDRRIYIEQGDATGESSGEANVTISGGKITNCEIKLTSDSYEDAKTYIALLTHELGHCLGLAHPQETAWAIMSYFYKEDEFFRLEIDDKMGIVHLYPEQNSNGKEAATYGMSCARQ